MIYSTNDLSLTISEIDSVVKSSYSDLELLLKLKDIYKKSVTEFWMNYVLSAMMKVKTKQKHR